MTNGWRRYNWDEILVDSLAIPTHLEDPGLYVTGTVYRSGSDKPAPPTTEVTLISSDYSQLFFTDIGEDGRFTFLLKDFKGPLKAVIQTKNKRRNPVDYDIALTTNMQNSGSGAYTRLYDDSYDTTYDMNPIQDSGVTTDSLIREYLVEGISYQVEDQLEISTDVTLNEVTVAVERLQSNKEKMTELYGEPEAAVSDRQLSQLVDEKPWHFGLMSLMMDACPGLYVDVRQSSTEYVSGGSFGGMVNDNMYHSDAASVQFKLENERAHRFFIYVDGRIVGASNERGVLSKMLSLYQIDELISMDPEIVESVELLIPDANQSQLYSRALFYALQNTSDDLVPENAFNYNSSEAELRDNGLAALAGDMRDLETSMELNSAPVAVISIYTYKGTGMYTRKYTKGIANVTIQAIASIKPSTMCSMKARSQIPYSPIAETPWPGSPQSRPIHKVRPAYPSSSPMSPKTSESK